MGTVENLASYHRSLLIDEVNVTLPQLMAIVFCNIAFKIPQNSNFDSEIILKITLP